MPDVNIKFAPAGDFMKVDLVMWTKNGAKTLPKVLKRINEVVPEEEVNQKFIIDDGSSDDTQSIAVNNGWKVYPNKSSGISAGANTALDLVTTEYFCSFEQDIILAPEWWSTVVKLMKGNVAVVEGQRFSSNKIIRALEEVQNTLYVTLDNDLYNTEIIRSIGGFPYNCPICVDAALKANLNKKGYEWIIIEELKSVHIRDSIWDFMRRQKKWWTPCVHSETCVPYPSLGGMVKRFLFSPIRGLQISFRKRMWQLFFVYPILRGVMLYYTIKYRK